VFLGGWTGSHVEIQHLQAPVPMGFLDFHRTFELEADRFGMELAARAGYDAAGFQRYVKPTQPVESKMSPLPPRELRLAKLEEMLASAPAATTSSSDDEFRLVQQAAQAIVALPMQRRAPTLKR
jgi:predicted Zn-dependent protease